ncbi:HTH marR-type domain-containing protein OS=Streptomyces griseorubiginosus OX=67304 GN=DWG14_07327 PE=4 SV=1 [Streptomyces griseorubiginosus]
MALAREISDAVDRLANLWSVAAQGARLRLSPHQLRALQILEATPASTSPRCRRAWT